MLYGSFINGASTTVNKEPFHVFCLSLSMIIFMTLCLCLLVRSFVRQFVKDRRQMFVLLTYRKFLIRICSGPARSWQRAGVCGRIFIPRYFLPSLPHVTFLSSFPFLATLKGTNKCVKVKAYLFLLRVWWGTMAQLGFWNTSLSPCPLLQGHRGDCVGFSKVLLLIMQKLCWFVTISMKTSSKTQVILTRALWK